MFHGYPAVRTVAGRSYVLSSLVQLAAVCPPGSAADRIVIVPVVRIAEITNVLPGCYHHR